jgi:Transcriptional regulatory protein, C terminal
MSAWASYPPDYRAREVGVLAAAARAGECVSVAGLSGAGKSNLLGFVAHTQSTPAHPFVLIDCNRLPEVTPPALLQEICCALGVSPKPNAIEAAERLDALITKRLSPPESSLTLLLDRFDVFAGSPAVANILRSMRDAYKYQLTFVIATRRPLPPDTELAELFYAHTLWLGALCDDDARWNVECFADRHGLAWDPAAAERLIAASGSYPSFLRAVCEAHASGAALELQSLAAHPAVRKRLDEFLADKPDEEELRRSGLEGLPLLLACQPPASGGAANLTAKESRLLGYFQSHPGAVCEKDDLIRAVWPEDRVFERGVRDDSLAQLVRRLREKIEADPANPRRIQTAPGRGYTYKP